MVILYTQKKVKWNFPEHKIRDIILVTLWKTRHTCSINEKINKSFCIHIGKKYFVSELTNTITILKICQNYLVAGDASSNILVWKKQKSSWKLYSKLPAYHCPPVCMDIHRIKKNIIVSYSDNKVRHHGKS